MSKRACNCRSFLVPTYMWYIYIYLYLVKQLVLSQEDDYRDADSKLVEEDMRVMTDFELHNLCLLHQVHMYVKVVCRGNQAKWTAVLGLWPSSLLCMLVASATYIHIHNQSPT